MVESQPRSFWVWSPCTSFVHLFICSFIQQQMIIYNMANTAQDPEYSAKENKIEQKSLQWTFKFGETKQKKLRYTWCYVVIRTVEKNKARGLAKNHWEDFEWSKKASLRGDQTISLSSKHAPNSQCTSSSSWAPAMCRAVRAGCLWTNLNKPPFAS